MKTVLRSSLIKYFFGIVCSDHLIVVSVKRTDNAFPSAVLIILGPFEMNAVKFKIF